jgi:uncharacterized protein (TIGR02145 family)
MKKGSTLLTAISLISMIFLIYGCKKATAPTLVTAEVTGITVTSALSGGEITADGGGDITAKGVCWNTTGEPTTADPKTNDGTGSDSFTSTLSPLIAATTYYTRAYATNEAGTSYGEEFTFTTKIADGDGNQYTVVKIGSAVWMAENLKTTKYNDNSLIPNVTENAAWANQTTGAYCWYNNDMAFNKPIYGALYNWFAVNNGKLCPAGWHVATDAEYKTMEQSIGMAQAELDVWGWRGTDQGTKMKNSTGWSAGQTGNNASGFAAIPGGYRFYQDGSFYNQNMLSYWWTATEHDATRAWYRRLDGDNAKVYRASGEKPAGKYVRCVKN